MDLAIRQTEFGPDTDQGFIVKPSDITEVGCTLDLSLFGLTASDTSIPAGTPLGKVTATGKYGAYSGGDNRTEEVWVFTESGSGLTAWTFTPDGGTASVSLDDDATAADVQAAFDTKYGEGNFIVTRTAVAPSVWQAAVNPDGELANTNLTPPTTTPTGGTGAVGVTTDTAGGAEGSADGRQVFAGVLFDTIPTRGKTSGAVGASRIVLGAVYEAKLPSPVDSAAKADMPSIAFV